jgi:hypothetical protein
MTELERQFVANRKLVHPEREGSAAKR